jgi:hypothetical protein
LLAVTRHGFTFYVAAPVSSIRERIGKALKREEIISFSRSFDAESIDNCG